jgi:hypothetical protein
MMNPLTPFMGELELREVHLVDTIDRLEQNEIDQFHAEALEVEIEALYSEMVTLEGRLDGLHAALMMAAEMAERSHSAQ